MERLWLVSAFTCLRWLNDSGFNEIADLHFRRGRPVQRLPVFAREQLYESKNCPVFAKIC